MDSMIGYRNDQYLDYVGRQPEWTTQQPDTSTDFRDSDDGATRILGMSDRAHYSLQNTGGFTGAGPTQSQESECGSDRGCLCGSADGTACRKCMVFGKLYEKLSIGDATEV